MRHIFIIVFAFFSIAPTFSQRENTIKKPLLSIPLITTYTPAEYNGGIQNWRIDQDSLGYIYVANNYGLLEFDGASWSSYPIAGTTKTRTVLVDQISNRIYVGGQKQLGYFEHTIHGLFYTSIIDSIPENIVVDEIWDLISFNGNIYGNVNGNIIEIEGDNITVLRNISNVEFLTQQGDELIAGSSKGLYVMQGSEEFNLVYETKQNLRGVIRQNDRYLLFTYDGEIFQLKDGVFELKSYPIAVDFLQVAKVNKTLLLSNGNIVIATQNNGLIIVDNNLSPVLHLTKNKGINHRTVLSLFEDNFKNLWVGLNNGISVIELGKSFSFIDENVGLKGTGYAASAYMGETYMGTSSGLFTPSASLNFISNKGYELVPGSEGLVNNVSVFNDEMVLSHHEGAYTLEDGSAKKFFDETGAWGFKQLNKSTWIGGTYFGFYAFNVESKYATYSKLANLEESSRVFEFQNDSTLWMAHGYKGVYKIILRNDSISKVSRYGKDDGFPSDLLISVYKIGNELVFTGEKGIYYYNSKIDRFEPHPFLNDFFKERHVSKIKEAEDESLYYIADGELGILKRKAIGIYEVEEKRFKKINQFISDDLENISIINNQALLIGAKEGFVLYEPELDNAIKEEFNTYLKSVSITNQTDAVYQISGRYFKNQSIEKAKQLRFEFSSPYFDGLSDIKYSYRLTPYEKEWSEWNSTNWKEYTNLSAGEYTFEVKSMNVYENESFVESYAFKINPEWYETNLAYAAYASLILFIFTSVVLARERKHKVEKKFINQSKEEVIASKEREISEFSEKTNQEIQSLKNQGLKKEIEHKNSQLASVTMHLLSKNEFVLSVRKKLNDAVVNKDTESLNKILKSIDRNIDEDEAWETFAFHFDQVHGNFLHKIKEEIHLTPQETKLCAYLKMNMSTKDIANLMNITIRGVELARYRLRKKLGIKRETNLTAYLEQY